MMESYLHRIYHLKNVQGEVELSFNKESVPLISFMGMVPPPPALIAPGPPVV